MGSPACLGPKKGHSYCPVPAAHFVLVKGVVDISTYQRLKIENSCVGVLGLHWL